jgi:hypothetical protein
MNTENEPDMDVSEEMDSLRQRVAELEQTEAERMRSEQDSVESRRKRDKQFILFLTVSPFLLEAFLFMINRRYMSNLFHGCNLPYGLAIQVAIVILALISFFALRSSLSVLRSGRVVLGWAMGFLAFVLFLIPAWVLIFLAPALLILLGSL